MAEKKVNIGKNKKKKTLHVPLVKSNLDFIPPSFNFNNGYPKSKQGFRLFMFYIRLGFTLYFLYSPRPPSMYKYIFAKKRENRLQEKKQSLSLYLSFY